MLGALLDVNRVALSPRASDKDAVLREVADLLTAPERTLDAEAVYDVLARREALASTGVGRGVAVPHGRVSGIGSVRMALAITREGVPFDAIDQMPVHIIVGMLGPAEEPRKHLAALADVSRILRDEAVRARLLAARTAAEARDILIGSS